MTSGLRRVLALMDRERVRFGVAIALAAALCLMLLARSVGWFAAGEPKRAAPPAIDMQLVELPRPAAAPPAPEAAPAAPPTHARAAQAEPVKHRIVHAQSTPAAPQKPVPHERAQPPVQNAEQRAQPETRAAGATPQPATAATSSNATAAAASATGATQARLLSQPVPLLPDDLRDQAYHAVALARFRVHRDGTFDVELVKPTQNPRLNQILLDTLHRWRFFPAMENGRPVESEQDVRVHFNVG